MQNRHTDREGKDDRLNRIAGFQKPAEEYAADTVIKTPFTAPDGEIDYHKEIVKKMPDPPKRKDRM